MTFDPGHFGRVTPEPHPRRQASEDSGVLRVKPPFVLPLLQVSCKAQDGVHGVGLDVLGAVRGDRF